MNFASNALFTLLACSFLAPAAFAQEKVQAPLRYCRVSDSAAKIYNLPDVKGKVIAKPAPKSIVAVHRERGADWLEVEVPGGFAVWVYGRYLKPTATSGIYEVTGNAVNLRPEPNSDVTSFPLRQRLQSRDQVAVIRQFEPDEPMEETWVCVWSPPGVRGLMPADQVENLSDQEDGHALWSFALASAGTETPKFLAPRDRIVQQGKADRAEEALKQARQELDVEAGKPTPDYGRVRSALEAVVREASGSPVAVEANVELQRLGQLEETLAVKEELYRERERRRLEALDAQRLVWERSRRLDPLREVFVVRGVLERRVGSTGDERYFLHYGGETRAELLCSSRRYDLSHFDSYEIGVKGAGVGELEPGVDRIDVARLEVLRRR
jgi:hypothetical protein